MPGNSFVNFLENRDIYGQPIRIVYQGSDVFRTRLGAFFTLITYSLIAFNFVSLIQAYFDNSNQKESQATMIQDLYDKGPYSLAENQYYFAIGWESTFPTNIGRVRLYKTSYVRNQNRRQLTQLEEELDLFPCSE